MGPHSKPISSQNWREKRRNEAATIPALHCCALPLLVGREEDDEEDEANMEAFPSRRLNSDGQHTQQQTYTTEDTSVCFQCP
ncbi:luminal-binding protein 5 [Sesbania bispinosa]|nr:luminal-binding protein 5 [Sesbania bispinosa]